MINSKLLIIGGGTGGHISPGIALYEECLEKKIDVLFLAGKKDKKYKYLSDIKSEHLFYYNAPGLTLNPLKIPFFLIKLFFAVLKVKKIIKSKGISRVIGMGGYISAPALWAAKSLKIPLFLCEQNSVPGRVTLFFSKYARNIFITFENSIDYFKEEIKARVRVAGNPIRKKVFSDNDKTSSRKFFNLQHCDYVILAIGGSQGALRINDLVLELKTRFPADFNRIGIIWCTGTYSFEKYKNIIYENSNIGSIYISAFVEEVGMAYTASDIAIARSGAGVMMELAATGVPSILIPYPHAAADHQNKNADDFVENGAAIKIADNNANAATIGPVLLDILSNSRRLQRMKDAVSARARIYAAGDILEEIIK